MDNQPQIIDITEMKDDELHTINLSSHNTNSSPNNNVNFGPGIEMLMNDRSKKTSSPSNNDSSMRSIDALENELNSLTIDTDDYGSKKDSFREVQDSMFDTEKLSVKIDEMPNIKIGVETSRNEEQVNSTWDGYKTFNDIPIDPTKEVSTQPKMTREELVKEKFTYLKKLEALERNHGIELTQKYTFDSNLDEMRGEYEMIKAEKEKQNNIKFQAKMLMATVTGLEFLNNKVDPFDLKLDGWGESVNENINDYDDVFAELHDKYKSKAHMAPELKLLFMLGGSAIMVHMTNTMFKSAMPGMDDIMRQNPELMQQFTQAASSSMNQKAPGFGNFMGNMGNNFGGEGGGHNNENNPPQAPSYQQQERTSRYSEPSNRPDLNFSNRPNEPNDGIPMDSYGSAQQTDNVNRDVPNNFNQTPAMRRTDPTEKPVSNTRPEMKGPTNLEDILSGLKTKKINIKEIHDEGSAIINNKAPPKKETTKS